MQSVLNVDDDQVMQEVLSTHLDRALCQRIGTAVARPALDDAALNEVAVNEVALSKRDGVASTQYAELVGASVAMNELFDYLRLLERVNAPTVLVTGESGTGKELVARAIHSCGPRRAAPYVEVDCAAIPDTLIESELFGHEKGAFTDARQMKPGLFEVARGGVLFLDEIGEMAPTMQAKLLRALENRRFKRVGGLTPIDLDATVVAATNRDLAAEVKAGRFRQDLFFRLNVVPLRIPPLRMRANDIPGLARHMMKALSATLHRPATEISAAAMDLLCGYPWPGNVRELRNVMERALILKRGEAPIDVSDLPLEVQNGGEIAPPDAEPFQLPAVGVRLADVERSLVRQALTRSDGNRTQAAKLLGISRFALRYRVEKFQLERALELDIDDEDVDEAEHGSTARDAAFAHGDG